MPWHMTTTFVKKKYKKKVYLDKKIQQKKKFIWIKKIQKKKSLIGSHRLCWSSKWAGLFIEAVVVGSPCYKRQNSDSIQPV